MEKISGKIADLDNETFFKGTIYFQNNVIDRIERDDNVGDDFILPGLVDSHVHIESSMLVPMEFSKYAAKSGVLSVVADPHEIANVLGVKGVDYFIDSINEGAIKIYFAAPSCVPAVDFEKGGGEISTSEILHLMAKKEVVALGEMMNFPGVLSEDGKVMKKLEIAKKSGKPVDGHAPGLKGKALEKYISSGISTDHESIDIDEAEEKIMRGMKVQIRKGSAADSLNEMKDLINKFPEEVMICSDDIHPDELSKGYMSRWIGKLFENFDAFKVLKVVSLNAVKHYNLGLGLLRKGDKVDFIVVDTLEKFNVKMSYINGKNVLENINENIDNSKVEINSFKREYLKTSELKIASGNTNVNIIEVFDKQLFTRKSVGQINIENGYAESKQEDDILKLVLINRYEKSSKPVIAFAKGFGLKNCAIASSISHDNHNIIAIGASDDKLMSAINLIIKNKGGIAFSSKSEEEILPLKVGGILSLESIDFVSGKYEYLNKLAYKYKSILKSPFMTLSFLALPVIPEIKLSLNGLFDVNNFENIPLFID